MPYHIYLMIIFLFLGFLGIDWHGRTVFLYCAYPGNGHGKTGKKFTKHYKTNWTFFQRLLWIPTFKEKYDVNIDIIVILSYINFLLYIATITCFLIEELVLKEVHFSKTAIIIYCVYTVIRFRYQVGVARNYKKRKKRRSRR